MANDFNHGVDVLGTSDTEVYTCPTGTVAVVIGMWVSNINASVQQTVTIKREYAALATTRTLVKETPVAVAGGFSPMAEIGKLVLKAGDKILAAGNNANQLEMGVEVLEIS